MGQLYFFMLRVLLVSLSVFRAGFTVFHPISRPSLHISLHLPHIPHVFRLLSLPLVSQALSSYLERVLVDLVGPRSGAIQLKGKDKEEEDTSSTFASFSFAPKITSSDSHNRSSDSHVPNSSSTHGGGMGGLGGAIAGGMGGMGSMGSMSGMAGMAGMAGGGGNMNSSHGKAEESYSTRLSPILSVPECMRERGQDAKALYALSERIVAAESCCFGALVSALLACIDPAMTPI